MSDLATSLLERRQEIKSNVQAVIATMADHHARGVPISAELAMAVPVIAATLCKSPNERMKGIGAKLILEALKHNLNLFEYANSVDTTTGKATQRVEHSIADRLNSDPALSAETADLLFRLLPNGNPD